MEPWSSLDAGLSLRHKITSQLGDFPGVQWLRLHTPSAEGLGLIPGQGIKILNAAIKTWHSQINVKILKQRMH